MLPRGLARTVGFAGLGALALVGLALAVFSVQGGDGPVSLTGLARHVGLPDLLDRIGSWLARLEDGSQVEWWSILGGSVAIAVGALLVASALWPRLVRTSTVADGAEGRLAVGRGALKQKAERAALGAGATSANAAFRRRVGRPALLRVTATRPASAAAETIDPTVDRAVVDAVQAVDVRPRVRVSAGRGPRRVR